MHKAYPQSCTQSFFISFAYLLYLRCLHACVHCPIALLHNDLAQLVVDTTIAGDHFPRTDGLLLRY